MPACGERVGGKFSQRGTRSLPLFGCTCSGKVLGRYRGRTFEAGVCRDVEVAYDGDARHRRLRSERRLRRDG
eukprot:scaffold37282_cov58-Phaeocystis_antarctica.AAC.4